MEKKVIGDVETFWLDLHGPERWEVLLRIVLIWLFVFAIFLILRKWIPNLIEKSIKGKKSFRWASVLTRYKVFTKLTILLFPATLYAMLPLIHWGELATLKKFTEIAIVITLTMFVNAVFDAFNAIYEGYQVARNRPIRIFIQTIQVLVYFTGFILIISIILSKTPHNLFVGLGAFAAVLLLIFKDVIAGFVAGIQLNTNSMLRPGDWIEVHNTTANGIVEELNLYTVKVRNWDKTITMVPTYQLVSTPFTNWRGMWESNGRRIMRSVYIDMRSVHFMTIDEMESMKSSDYLKNFVEAKQKELINEQANDRNVLDVNHLTNLTLFRHYMENWLSNNMLVNVDMLIIVRELSPTPTGVPIQVYCFSKNKEWTAYEHLQADIFDHIMAIIPEFKLHIYEYSHPSWSS